MNYSRLVIFLASFVMVASCVAIDQKDVQDVVTVSATLSNFVEEDNVSSTKTGVYVDANDNISRKFVVGDILGIYPTNGNQISFTLNEGSITDNGQRATFDGGDWALKANRTYYSYLPFQKSAYSSFAPASNVPVTYLGQKSMSFGSTINVSQYDYLGSVGTTSNSEGSLDFAFQRIGVLLRVKFTLPTTGTYQSLVFSMDDGSNFIPVTGHMNLTSSSVSLIPDTYASSLTVDLNNSAGTIGQTAYVFVMLPPMTIKTSGKEITLTLSYNNGSSSQYKLYKNNELSIFDINVGTIYRRDAVLVETPDGANTEDFSSSEYEW